MWELGGPRWHITLSVLTQPQSHTAENLLHCTASGYEQVDIVQFLPASGSSTIIVDEQDSTLQASFVLFERLMGQFMVGEG